MPTMRQQIMFSLCEWFERYVGKPVAVDPESNLVDWLREHDFWDDFDFCDLIYGIEHGLGVQIPREEWTQCLNGDAETADEWEQFVRPRLTFGALADLIAQHIAPVSFDAVEICLQRSAEAGAFLGLRAIAKEFDHSTGRIAPSTRILGVLQKRDLELFWTRVRWQTCGAVAPLRFPHRRWGERLFFVGMLGVFGAIVSVFLKQLDWFLACLEATMTSFRSGEALRWKGNPLPGEIQTFRDLAELIAEHLSNNGNTRLVESV